MNYRNNRKTGFVKHLRLDKGFGFITDDDTGQDYFFHCTACSSELPFDEQLIQRHVSYGLVVGDRGPKCVELLPAGY